jgi:hypothetical protein
MDLREVKTNVVTLWTQSLFKDETTVDVVFLVGSGKTPISAHRLVLAASSKVFRAMLFGPMSEAQSKEVKIGDDGLTGQAFTALLEYIYTGKTTISEENFFGLRSLAQMYDYPDLLEQTTAFAVENVTERSCLSMMCTAQLWAAEGNLTHPFHFRNLLGLTASF